MFYFNLASFVLGLKTKQLFIYQEHSNSTMRFGIALMIYSLSKNHLSALSLTYR